MPMGCLPSVTLGHHWEVHVRPPLLEVPKECLPPAVEKILGLEASTGSSKVIEKDTTTSPLLAMTGGISKSMMSGRTLSTVKELLCASTPPASLFTVIVQSARCVAAVAGGDVAFQKRGRPGGEGDGGGQRAANGGDVRWRKGIVGIEGEGDGGSLCGVENVVAECDAGH